MEGKISQPKGVIEVILFEGIVFQGNSIEHAQKTAHDSWRHRVGDTELETQVGAIVNWQGTKLRLSSFRAFDVYII